MRMFRQLHRPLIPVFLVLCQTLGSGAATGVLRGKVFDGASGQLTPCTVEITDAEGGTVLETPAFGRGFRCDGQFEKTLPAGEIMVRVTRGFETRRAERRVRMPDNGTITLEFSLERNVDLRRRGWYSGDSHVHMLHGERTLPVSFDFVALSARAEDLQYLSLAQAWTIDKPTPEALEQELSSRSTQDCVLTWNMESPKNFYRGDAERCLGHCWTLGMRGRTRERASVIDLLTAASAHDYEAEKPTFANFESHQLIREQGGAVFYSHPARWWAGPWGGRNGFPLRESARISNLAAELPLDVVIGPTFDGLDVLTGPGEFEANAMAFELWAMLLNHGYHLAATASSDACFDRPQGAVPGIVRTYTYLPGPFSIESAAAATAKGRTFVTSGPLLLVTLDGEAPGSEHPADGRPRLLRVEGWAAGSDCGGLTRLELLRNGQLMRSLDIAPGKSAYATTLTITESETAWYCVRLFGSEPKRQRAFTGAFYFEREPRLKPEPVRTRADIELVDAATGRRLSGVVREVQLLGPWEIPGEAHALPRGEMVLVIPATVRLRAEAPGYKPQTRSLFLDNPALLDFILRLSADDLLRWTTYERTRQLLEQVPVEFRLERAAP